jgi:hypothetical protein
VTQISASNPIRLQSRHHWQAGNLLELYAVMNPNMELILESLLPNNPE